MEKLPSGSFFVTREEIREKSEKLLCAALRHNLIHAAIGGIPLLFTLLFSLFSATGSSQQSRHILHGQPLLQGQRDAIADQPPQLPHLLVNVPGCQEQRIVILRALP